MELSKFVGEVVVDDKKNGFFVCGASESDRTIFVQRLQREYELIGPVMIGRFNTRLEMSVEKINIRSNNKTCIYTSCGFFKKWNNRPFILSYFFKTNPDLKKRWIELAKEKVNHTSGWTTESKKINRLLSPIGKLRNAEISAKIR